jgi:hypothetical protein
MFPFRRDAKFGSDGPADCRPFEFDVVANMEVPHVCMSPSSRLRVLRFG